MTKTIMFGAIAVFLFPPHVLALQDDLDPKIKNESSLEFVPKGSTLRGKGVINNVTGATYCSGSVEKSEELKRVGISTLKLSGFLSFFVGSVQCTVGDFDGNGYLDFALWGYNEQTKKNSYLVFFFEKSKLLRTILIESKKSGHLLVHYLPRKVAGKHGEPVSAHDGLFEIGETSGYDDETKGIVYLFESQSGKFKEIEFGEKK